MKIVRNLLIVTALAFVSSIAISAGSGGANSSGSALPDPDNFANFPFLPCPVIFNDF